MLRITQYQQKNVLILLRPIATHGHSTSLLRWLASAEQQRQLASSVPPTPSVSIFVFLSQAL